MAGVILVLFYIAKYNIEYKLNISGSKTNTVMSRRTLVLQCHICRDDMIQELLYS